MSSSPARVDVEEGTRSAISSKSDDSLPANESGAPVEKISPLGYHVDWISVIFLNVSKMIGTGVFTTRRFISYYHLANIQ
jgi:hypothetical protein